MSKRFWLTFALGLSALGCSFDDSAKHCETNADCSSNEYCYERFCLPLSAREDGVIGRDRDGGSRADASPPDSSLRGDATSSGSDASAEPAAGSGGSGAGTEASGMSGVGGAGTNGGAAGASGTNGSSGTGASVGGMSGGAGTAAGASGSGGPEECQATREICNGRDDDCDMNSDENSGWCYTGGQLGCTVPADGSAPSCLGACVAGQQVCENGARSACTGERGPSAESCASSGGVAADEDCDGRTDEGCECNDEEDRKRDCYNGPLGTLNVGRCVAGKQRCKDGMLRECEGAVLPQDETCANSGSDDNCDNVVDNIPGLGMPCVAEASGSCRGGTLRCQNGSPTPVCQPAASAAESCNGIDDDCDGKSDETFNLMTSPTNCGTCGKSCAAGEECCGGRCTNIQNDKNNCGSCGNACTVGGRPSCCSGVCTDLVSDGNCGQCGKACGLLGGVACVCAMTPEGISCQAPLLGLCL